MPPKKQITPIAAPSSTLFSQSVISKALLRASWLTSQLSNITTHLKRRHGKCHCKTDDYLFLLWLVGQLGEASAADLLIGDGTQLNLPFIEQALLARVPPIHDAVIIEQLLTLNQKKIIRVSSEGFNKEEIDTFAKAEPRSPSLKLLINAQGTFLGIETPILNAEHHYEHHEEIRDAVLPEDLLRLLYLRYTRASHVLSSTQQLSGITALLPLITQNNFPDDYHKIHGPLMDLGTRVIFALRSNTLALDSITSDLFDCFDKLYAYLDQEISLTKEATVVDVVRLIEFTGLVYPYLSEENRRKADERDHIRKDFLKMLKKNPQKLTAIPAQELIQVLTRTYKASKKSLSVHGEIGSASTSRQAILGPKMTDEQALEIVEQLEKEENRKIETVVKAQHQKQIFKTRSRVHPKQEETLAQAGFAEVEKKLASYKKISSTIQQHPLYQDFLNAYTEQYAFQLNTQTIAAFVKDLFASERLQNYQPLLEEFKQSMSTLLTEEVANQCELNTLTYNFLCAFWLGEHTHRPQVMATQGLSAIMPLPANSKKKKKKNSKQIISSQAPEKKPLTTEEEQAFSSFLSEELSDTASTSDLQTDTSSEAGGSLATEIAGPDTPQPLHSPVQAEGYYRVAGFENNEQRDLHAGLSIRFIHLNANGTFTLVPPNAPLPANSPRKGLAFLYGEINYNNGFFYVRGIKTYDLHRARGSDGLYYPVEPAYPVGISITPYAIYYDQLRGHQAINIDAQNEILTLLSAPSGAISLIREAGNLLLQFNVPYPLVQLLMHELLPQHLCNFLFSSILTRPIMNRCLLLSSISAMDPSLAFALILDYLRPPRVPLHDVAGFQEAFEKNTYFTLSPEVDRETSPIEPLSRQETPEPEEETLHAIDLYSFLSENMDEYELQALREIFRTLHTPLQDPEEDITPYLETLHISTLMNCCQILSKDLPLQKTIRLVQAVMNAFPDYFSPIDWEEQIPPALVNEMIWSEQFSQSLDTLETYLNNTKPDAGILIEQTWKIYSFNKLMDFFGLPKRLLDKIHESPIRPIYAAIPILYQDHYHILFVHLTTDTLELTWLDPKSDLHPTIPQLLLDALKFMFMENEGIAEDKIRTYRVEKVFQANHDGLYCGTAAFSAMAHWATQLISNAPDIAQDFPHWLLVNDCTHHLPPGRPFEDYLTPKQKSLRRLHIELCNETSPEKASYLLRQFLEEIKKEKLQNNTSFLNHQTGGSSSQSKMGTKP